MARRKPDSVVSSKLYQRLSLVVIGLGLTMALLADGAPDAKPLAPTARFVAATPTASLVQTEPGATASTVDPVYDLADLPRQYGLRTAAPETGAESLEQSLPKKGYARAVSDTRPSQAQIDALIRESYVRSGSDGGGD